ncbi:hypothetical protein EVAR_24431_1 [Eumeta japonica]|uniref:Uncharacterized protein n=1 Tax=Eumeta variegata TaxID=151549 RepID=A0A4C1VT19_EUMVA|nr:hypothetical protein EVAR_24431_1 [Eumeta japonica]
MTVLVLLENSSPDLPRPALPHLRAWHDTPKKSFYRTVFLSHRNENHNGSKQMTSTIACTCRAHLATSSATSALIFCRGYGRAPKAYRFWSEPDGSPARTQSCYRARFHEHGLLAEYRMSDLPLAAGPPPAFTT